MQDELIPFQTAHGATNEWIHERARILRNWGEEVEILCSMLKEQKIKSERLKNTFLTELDHLQSNLEAKDIQQERLKVLEAQCKSLKIENERLQSAANYSSQNLLRQQLIEKTKQCSLYRQEANHLRETLEEHKHQEECTPPLVKSTQTLQSELAAAKTRIRVLELSVVSKGFRLKQAESAAKTYSRIALEESVELNIKKMRTAIQATEDELKELRLQNVLTGEGTDEIKEVKQQLSQMNAMLDAEVRSVAKLL